MSSHQMEETLLPKWLALPIFASDPLSSVAYATEAAMVVLVAASAAAAKDVFPISIAIAVLLAIVVASYRQTVLVYQSSGGAYIVSKENLGRLPSLVAAAALLTDYVLTVAVSVAAGVLALTSAVSVLRGHELALSLLCVGLISLANLRGVKEAGVLFALPTYAFVTSIFVLLATGFVRCASGTCPRAVAPHPMTAGVGAVTVFVLLRAFASGSTALTGVEAIANGVNAFRRPHGKNAAKTLAILGTIAIVMFVGVSWLAVHMHAVPTQTGTPSVLSEIARGVFPAGSGGAFMYWAIQILTLAVLVLAANTSFQGFPRLAALLARDRFFARQFTNLGDRLVFSNGIIVLAGIAALLLWAYNANVNSLIHLYVIGVFTAFTLSQLGMIRYWLRTRDDGLADKGRGQHDRSECDRHGHVGRDLDEVRRGRLDRDGRDSGPGARVSRDQSSLPAFRPSPACGCRRCSVGDGSRRTRRCCGSSRSTWRQREPSGTRARSPGTGRSGPCSLPASTRTRGFGRGGGTSLRRSRSSRSSRRTRVVCRHSSRRSGACHGESPTSSRWSSRSSSSASRCSRRPAGRRSASSCG